MKVKVGVGSLEERKNQRRERKSMGGEWEFSYLPRKSKSEQEWLKKENRRKRTEEMKE